MAKKKLGTPWTETDIRVMRSCAKAGESARIAAKKLGRSRGAVAFKAMNEGIRFRSINQPRGVQKKLHQVAA